MDERDDNFISVAFVPLISNIDSSTYEVRPFHYYQRDNNNGMSSLIFFNYAYRKKSKYWDMYG